MGDHGITRKWSDVVTFNVNLFLGPSDLLNLSTVCKHIAHTFTSFEDEIFCSALRTSFKPLLSFQFPYSREPSTEKPKVLFMAMMSSFSISARASGETNRIANFSTSGSCDTTVLSEVVRISTMQGYFSKWVYGNNPFKTLILRGRGVKFCPLCTDDAMERQEDAGRRKELIGKDLFNEEKQQRENFLNRLINETPTITNEGKICCTDPAWTPTLGEHKFAIKCTKGCGFHGEFSFTIRPNQSSCPDSISSVFCQCCDSMSCECCISSCQAEECGQSMCSECTYSCEPCGTDVCSQCTLMCEVCDAIICVVCSFYCENCEKVSCGECSCSCESCGSFACESCFHNCASCNVFVCNDCCSFCDRCEYILCEECSVYCETCKLTLCKNHDVVIKTDFVTLSTCTECRRTLSTVCNGEAEKQQMKAFLMMSMMNLHCNASQDTDDD